MIEGHLARDHEIWGNVQGFLLFAYGFTCYCKGGDSKEGSMVKIWEVSTSEVVRNISVLNPVSDMNTTKVIVISETNTTEESDDEEKWTKKASINSQWSLPASTFNVTIISSSSSIPTIVVLIVADLLQNIPPLTTVASQPVAHGVFPINSSSNFTSVLEDSLMVIIAEDAKTEIADTILYMQRGLPVKYESIQVVASATSVSLEFLAELLVDCESRQLEFVKNMLSRSLCHRNSPPRSLDVSYPVYNNDIPDWESSLATAAIATILDSYLALVPNVLLSPIVPIVSTDSSTIAVVNDVSLVTTNVHPMQTRSKSGVFKLKLYATTLTNHEPLTIDEVQNVEKEIQE
ncbi:hypothetical protein PVK06_002646 [Gossypium arboreum]|uniref:Uncharacterized protein n=1 Tax=Gossypium arboreum TaxID=29729 RepID=A0ABR0R4B7_GOSAR|nr:hypothetical protein PVK06_002646 [Gossypium arboreum]